MTRNQWSNMSDEERRTKVAELCGWRDIRIRPLHVEYHEFTEDLLSGFHDDYGDEVAEIPYYLTDLNAMHELEGLMSEAEYLVYVNCHLSRTSGHEENGRIISATASQRAEAFVLAMESEV